MRDPSIHISLSQMRALAEKLNIKLSKPKLLSLFKEARELSLNHRAINSKQTKKESEKANKVTLTPLQMAHTVADILYSIEIKNFIGAKKIKMGSPLWNPLRELTLIIKDFSEACNMEFREACIKFINMGFELYKQNKSKTKIRVYFLQSRAQQILDTYQSIQTLQEDPTPQDTQDMYDLYTVMVLNRAGIKTDYKSNPAAYINFKLAKDLARSLNVDNETYMKAQFAALDYCNGIPRIEDLSSDKAKERLINYVSKNNYQMYQATNKPVDTLSSINWNEFKS